MQLAYDLIENYASHDIGIFSYFVLLVFVFALFRKPRLIGRENIIIFITGAYALQYASLYSLFPRGENNLIVINITELVVGQLYFLYLYFSLKQPLHKLIIIVLSSVFLVAHVVNLIFFQGVNVLTTLTTMPQYLTLSIVIYARIRQMILNDEINLHNLEFWFLLGSLISFSLPLSQIALEPYLNTISIDLAVKMLVIETIAAWSYNIAITLGLLWKKPRNTYSLS